MVLIYPGKKNEVNSRPARKVYIFQQHDLRLMQLSQISFLQQTRTAVGTGKFFCSAVHDKIPSPREFLVLELFL